MLSAAQVLHFFFSSKSSTPKPLRWSAAALLWFTYVYDDVTYVYDDVTYGVLLRCSGLLMCMMM